MKVMIHSPSGDLKALRRRFELEGDEVVSEGGDIVVKDVEILPRVALNEFGISAVTRPLRYFVTRGWNDQWSEQAFVGLPMMSMMNQDLGFRIPTGCVMRAVNGSIFESRFENDGLKGLLKAMDYRGFVSLGLDDLDITDVYLGVPFYGLYCLLESITVKASDFLLSPSHLMESWTVSLLLSRPPYPFSEKATKASFSLEPRTERHFWPFTQETFRHSFSSTNSRVGVATNWGSSLWKASDFALTTCRSLKVPEAQYRTDVFDFANRSWNQLQHILV